MSSHRRIPRAREEPNWATWRCVLAGSAMRSISTRLVVASVIFTLAASCSLYETYQAEQPANILELESRLVKACFNRVPIETPEQNGAVAELPLYRLNRYQSASGSVYW